MTNRRAAGLTMRLLLAFLTLACAVMPLRAQDDVARALFERLGPAAVQVRVIDRASGDRAAIGSGFQIDPAGTLVTNFHVVAEVAKEPARYRLEYAGAGGAAVALEIIDVDVVHDIALLANPVPLPATVPLAARALGQGERIYAIGNPLDLAMTIIEGTYNGYVEGARYRKILFSASLNPGMSGGPALNAAGELVGINVARGGEQISFLVPVDFLAELRSRAADPAWRGKPLEERIATALRADQDAWFASLLDAAWASQEFQSFRVPGRISPTVRCWGGSESEPDALYEHVYQECGSDDTLYVEPMLETGGFRYAFHAFGSESLGVVRFYSLLASHYGHAPWFGQGDETQMGNFACREDFLQGRGLDWRISFCARPYRRFEGLFDISVAMASTGFAERGMVVNLGINGVSAPRARLFLRRFVESVEWRP